MVQYLLYEIDTPIEKVKEFVGEGKVFPSFSHEDFDKCPEMWHINTRFGIQTLHSNTYIVKTSDDTFIMSKESFNELLIDEIENIKI